MILKDDDDDYYGYHERGWVDTDNEEEPMELPEDHPDASSGRMRMQQEETVLIQKPQAEMMMKMVMMTQPHPMVVMRTQMMIQSQSLQQVHRHLSPTTRCRYIA
jgi:hypothetical protein